MRLRQLRPFLERRNGADDAKAEELGPLHGDQPDAAGGGVQQDRVARSSSTGLVFSSQ